MQVPEFLPITSDYGFKVTFGNPDNTLFLRRALQALIQSEVSIREVTLERSVFEGLTAESRGGVYDLSCVDEHGRHFIVEMQVARSPHFLHRLKFYAFHKMNALVGRGGAFNWGGLPPIYCIALLSEGILPGTSYRTVANLRTESGELLDPQLTFVLVELSKFHLPESAVHTDLEKLLYTMQTLDQPLDLSHYPAFWGEDWLRVAIDELSTRNMSPQQREQFARVIARRMDIRTAEDERAELEARAAQVAAAEQQAAVFERQAVASKAAAAAAEQQAAAAEQQAVASKAAAAAAEQQAVASREAAAAAEHQVTTTIRNLLALGKFTPEEIAVISGSTPEQVRQLQKLP